MFRKNILIIILCSLLIARVSCQEGDSNNLTIAEENTTNVTRATNKHNAFGKTNNPEEQEAQQTTIGLNSLLTQTAGNSLTNTFNNSNRTTREINSVDLFNVDKVKQNLASFRRGLDLISKFSVFLNKFLPSPSSNEAPYTTFSNEVRFYPKKENNYLYPNQLLTKDSTDPPSNTNTNSYYNNIRPHLIYGPPPNMNNVPIPYMNPNYQAIPMIGLPQLPLYEGRVQFKNLNISNSASQGRSIKYGSIAEIPLEYPTFSDSLNGDLHDSFGLPINADLGSRTNQVSLTKE